MTVDEKGTTRTFTTLQFGEISVEPRHIFTFKSGVLGFERLREFVLISEEETVPFKWLISLEETDIGFPLLSPWLIDTTYNPGKSFDLDSQVLFVVITLEDGKGKMTANMKAPIVLDVTKQTGEQIILPSDRYSTHFVIPKNNKGK